MSDRVYLIASGCYSDYSIDCAFTTNDVALEYAAHRNNITVSAQRQWQEFDALPYNKRNQQVLWEFEREHSLNDYSYRVESRDLHETLPVVK